jgi:glycerophosphoryl diester phosphodiesterase
MSASGRKARYLCATILAMSVTPQTASAMDSPKHISKIVWVIGHRGAAAWMPEHTLASYARAIADGADLIEPDLVMTKDAILVARHENDISGTTDVSGRPEFASRRTTKTIDGKAVTGYFTEDFTLAELKTLRAKERLSDLRGTSNDGKFQIPTFDEIIDFVAAESAVRHRVVGLIPEIKHSSYFRSVGLPLEDKVLEVLKAHEYSRAAPVEIQSFEIANLRYLRERIGRGSNVRLLQLLDEPDMQPYDCVVDHQSLTYRQMMTPSGLREIARYADAVGPWTRSIIPLRTDDSLGEPTSLVVDAHAQRLEVHPYTFRPENSFLPRNFRDAAGERVRNESGSIAEMRAYLDAGIDAFFTDDPALGRRALADKTDH